MTKEGAQIFKFAWRRIDHEITFWFTVWLFWINKPGPWKWVFLGGTLLTGLSVGFAEKEEAKKT